MAAPTRSELNKLIITHINEVGLEEASEIFGQSKMLLKAWVKGNKKPNDASRALFLQLIKKGTTNPLVEGDNGEEIDENAPGAHEEPELASPPVATEKLVQKLRQPVKTVEAVGLDDDNLDRPLTRRGHEYRTEETEVAPTTNGKKQRGEIHPASLSETIPQVTQARQNTRGIRQNRVQAGQAAGEMTEARMNTMRVTRRSTPGGGRVAEVIATAPRSVARPVEIDPEDNGLGAEEGEELGRPEVTAPVMESNLSLNQKVLTVLMPCYRHLCPLTHVAFAKMYKPEKMHHDLEFNTQLIEARNMLAHRFLYQTQDPLSFWMDDDMIVPCGDADWWLYNVQAPEKWPRQYAGVHTINRLASHGLKFVSGVYFGRNPKGRAMYAEGILDNQENGRIRQQLPRNELRQSQGVAAGCMLVHRDVFLDIMEKFPADHEITQETPYPFFNKQSTEGEDMAFSQRAIGAGHQPYVDLAVIAGHLGHCIYGPWNTK